MAAEKVHVPPVPASPRAQLARLRARVLDGERKLSAIKPVWSLAEPLYGKWLALLAEYEALALSIGEGT